MLINLAITENLQQKLFVRSSFEFTYRIPRMKLESVDKFYLPELTNRFFDTLSIQKGLGKILIDFSTSTLQIVFGLLLLPFYHPFLILFSIILVIIAYSIIRITGPEGLKTSLTESKHKYEVAHWLEEIARTLETFKLAGTSELPMKRTDELVPGYLEARKKHFRILKIILPVIVFLCSCPGRRISVPMDMYEAEAVLLKLEMNMQFMRFVVVCITSGLRRTDI